MNRAGTWLVAALAMGFGSSSLAETLALTNARVHAGTGEPVIDNATIVVRDGRIAALGPLVPVPTGARVVDVAGRDVTPGLFDAFGTLGIEEVDLEERADDHEVASDELASSVRIIDAFNPRSIVVDVNRAEGVSYAVIAPASTTFATKEGQVVPGNAAVVGLHAGAEGLRQAEAGMVFVFGQEGSGLSGGSRAVALARLRDFLDEAKDYRRVRSNARANQFTRAHADLDAIARVLDGKTPLLALANRAADIEAMLAVAKEYGVKLVIVGGAEAWLLAPALAATDTPVILDPTLNVPTSFDTLAARDDAAAILHAAGVRLAVAFPDFKNPRNARQSAGRAVAWGLPHEAGVAAITGNPARMFGVDDRVGVLKPGRDADLIVWDGDPLEITTFPVMIFSGGREASLSSRQTRLRDRYRDPATAGN